MRKHLPIDRRRVILAGSALAGDRRSAQSGRRPGGTCSRRRPAGGDAAISRQPRCGEAQGRVVRVGRPGMARLELFRLRRLHQAGPAARADERRAEGGCLGPAGNIVLAGRHREDAQRHDIAGCAGGERQRRRAALVETLLVRGLRAAGRERSLGFPPRRPSPDPVVQRARWPDRFGHAVVVLGAAGAHHVGQARGIDDAEGRGGAGAASRRRSRVQAEGAAVGSAALQHHVLCGTRAGERPEDRHRGRRHGHRAARSAVATGRDLFGAAPRSGARGRAEGSRARPAIARPCISPGTDRIRPRRRSAIG